MSLLLYLLMKYIYTLLIISLFVQKNNAQTSTSDTIKYEVIYDMNYQINASDTTDIKTEKMILRIGENYTDYLSYDKVQRDSTVLSMQAQGNLDARKLKKAKIYYRVIKNKKDGGSMFVNRLGVNKFYFDIPTPEFDWNIHTEEKEIKGYVCKKATVNFAGRNYIAWYAPEIPISEGPYKFSGLPGLILELYDTENHYIFSLISFRKVDKKNDIDLTGYIKLTQKEYDDFLAKVEKKPSLLFKSDKISFSKEMMDKVDEKGRKKLEYENNPIELNGKN